MIRILAFLVALAALQFAAFAQAQTGQPDGQTFQQIDPDATIADTAEAAAVYAGLPALGGASEPEAPAPVIAAQDIVGGEDYDAPRGPAVRMIAAPVVQPLPPAPPAARAASSPLAAASASPFVIKSILPVEGTIRYGDWFWDESAAPRSGALVITVDLDARVISAFRDGHEIGTAVVLVGTQDHPTPLGTFPILTKERDNVSEKYNNAPMPFTLRLTWDGIAIHGSPVMNGYASHGCIGVPDEFAAKLFAAAKRGDKVVITRGRMIGLGDKIL